MIDEDESTVMGWQVEGDELVGLIKESQGKKASWNVEIAQLMQAISDKEAFIALRHTQLYSSGIAGANRRLNDVET
jgi:hypothetical protein